MIFWYYDDDHYDGDNGNLEEKKADGVSKVSWVGVLAALPAARLEVYLRALSYQPHDNSNGKRNTTEGEDVVQKEAEHRLVTISFTHYSLIDRPFHFVT